MRILGSIVQVSALSDARHRASRSPLSDAIAPQLVGHDHPRHVLQPVQQTPEEALGGVGIAPVLHEDVQHNAVLIHGAPQIVLHALDPDEHFIEMPLVSRPRSTASQTLSMAAHGAAAPRGAVRAPVR